MIRKVGSRKAFSAGASVAAMAAVLSMQGAQAQIIRDGTAGGAAGALTGPNFTIDALDGLAAGQNLFHSFWEFNIANGESATFTDSTTSNFANIITRITGNTISTIDGALISEVNSANLFFINPNGVVFNENATIDVQGGFYASTANELRFDTGEPFVADGATSAFSSASPSSFGFLGVSGDIEINGSQITLAGSSGASDFYLAASDVEISNGARITVQDRDFWISGVGEAILDLPIDVEATALSPIGSVKIEDTEIYVQSFGADQSGADSLQIYAGGVSILDSVLSTNSTNRKFDSSGFFIRTSELTTAPDRFETVFDFNDTNVPVQFEEFRDPDNSLSDPNQDPFLIGVFDTILDSSPGFTAYGGQGQGVVEFGQPGLALHGRADGPFYYIIGQSRIRFPELQRSMGISIGTPGVDDFIILLRDGNLACPNCLITVVDAVNGEQYLEIGNVLFDEVRFFERQFSFEFDSLGFSTSSLENSTVVNNGISGNININASQFVNVQNSDLTTNGLNGQSGDVNIRAGAISLGLNSVIDTSVLTSTSSDAGNISLTTDTRNLSSALSQGFLGGEIRLQNANLVTDVANTADNSPSNAGTISLAGEKLFLSDDAQISTSVRNSSGRGTGGDIFLFGVGCSEGPCVDIQSSTIETLNRGERQGGFIAISGDGVHIGSDDGEGAPGSVVRSATEGVGNAGIIFIRSPESEFGIQIGGGSRVETNSSSFGDAGTIFVAAPTVNVSDGATISSAATADATTQDPSSVPGGPRPASAGGSLFAGDFDVVKTVALQAYLTLLEEEPNNAALVLAAAQGVDLLFPFISEESANSAFALFEGDPASQQFLDLVTRFQQGGFLDSDTPNLDLLQRVSRVILDADAQGLTRLQDIDEGTLEAVFDVVDLISASSVTFDNAVIQTQNASSFLDRDGTGAIVSGRSGGVQIFGDFVDVINGSQIAASNFFTDVSGGGVSNGGDIRFGSSLRPINDLLIIDSSISAATNGSGVGGVISFHANEVSVLSLNGDADIVAFTLGDGDAGDISFDVEGRLLVQGREGISTTSIASSVADVATGDGGLVRVEAEIFELLDGAQISSGTFGSGNAGNVVVNVDDYVLIDGVGSESDELGVLASGIFTSAQNSADSGVVTGNAGEVRLFAQQLQLSNEGKIVTNTFGGANGGGDGGPINIEVERLILASGGSVSADSFAVGDGGDIFITASEFVQIRGDGNSASTGISSTSRLFADSVSGLLPGAAGSISIHSPVLNMSGSAEIDSSAFGNGNAGTIRIVDLDRFVLADGARLATRSNFGSGGNIEIEFTGGRFDIAGNGTIETLVQSGSGRAGDISIEGPDLILLDNADIRTSADTGAGGAINIDGGVIIPKYGVLPIVQSGEEEPVDPISFLNPSSSGGLSGTVVLGGLEGDVTAGTAALEAEFLDASDVLGSRCAATRALGAPSTLIQDDRANVGPSPNSVRPALYVPLNSVNESSGVGTNTQFALACSPVIAQ